MVLARYDLREAKEVYHLELSEKEPPQGVGDRFIRRFLLKDLYRCGRKPDCGNWRPSGSGSWVCSRWVMKT